MYICHVIILLHGPMHIDKDYTLNFEALKHYIINIMFNIAGTQTLMTIPLNFDLLAFLGPGFSYSEDKSCDPSNSSLRRKLFGQPERQVRRQ